MAALKELHEAGDDSALDNFLDGRVLFFGEEFSESGGSIELSLGIVREDTADHVLGGGGVPPSTTTLVVVRISIGVPPS